MDDSAQVLDLFQVSTEFHDGLASATIDRNGNARLVFYVEQGDDESGRRSKIVNARMIIPQNALPAMVSILLASMSPEGRKYAEAWHSGVVAHA